ncbi:MAG: acetyl-CoA carboxylase biotin carboxyl carrier protein subunit [Ignavibacteria bacterium]|nr:acetyl-CoA carboxylase biotin carboxyl carrier protein subunit [Ignavibacteria bacterium]
MDERKEDFVEFQLLDGQFFTKIPRKYLRRKKFQMPDKSQLKAFIPGVIQNIYVQVGQKVRRGEPLLVLEAMKMKNDVNSPVEGKIKSINVKIGDVVKKDQVLIEFSDFED